MQDINDFILTAAEQPWVLFVVLTCCVTDGFFPPIPSESVVVGLSSVSGSSGSPSVWLLGLVAAIGAFSGDNVAYIIGHRIGIQRWRWMRTQRMQGAFRWAGKELRRRSASLIMVARFIPIGRVAVNFTAGATHFNHCKFVALTAMSAILWATYSVILGYFFGVWFEDNHLVGALIAIVVAVILGIIIDLIISKIRGSDPLDGKDTPEEDAPTPPTV
ncbi:DedA family protein [Arthrobacter sp. M2012083]|uniref:DedA family protein n=1 Tax=Arthrobacter sp. M2012083 TaxID=1197706 RepID=UPI000315B27A|nr:DedA family protein [Arthrobacter sp. M2012083]